jgi:hypothetical protein
MENHPFEMLNLSELLSLLREHEHEIITLINTDPKIKRRFGGHNNSLVIANTCEELFKPEKLHHLFAKGIVYQKATLKLVSIPLVKMFNHGLCDHSDAISREIVEKGKDILIMFPEKLDGTMIQLFIANDHVWLTTRSILEGGEESIYLKLARSILKQNASHILDPSTSDLDHLTLIFELIHPKTKQFTLYNDREAMVLHSVYDQHKWHYWKTEDVIKFAKELNIEHSTLLLVEDASNLERGIVNLRTLLAEDFTLPEGSIACFEDNAQIIHRVKIKMDAYLLAMSTKSQISLKIISEQIWDKPELHDWNTYRLNIDEEVEKMHKIYHDLFMKWLSKIKTRYKLIMSIAETFENGDGGQLPESAKERLTYFKTAAQWLQLPSHQYNDFPLIMQRLRNGKLILEDVMQTDPIYPNLKNDIKSKRHREKVTVFRKDAKSSI